jgi:hypothetical protein
LGEAQSGGEKEKEVVMTLFHVIVRLGFVNGSCIDDVSFTMQADDEDDVRNKATPEYIVEFVSNDWGLPIDNVTVMSISKAHGRPG